MSVLERLERLRARETAPLQEAQDYVYGNVAQSRLMERLERVRTTDNDLVQRPSGIDNEEHYSRRPTTMIGKAFDLLSRGEYFSASILHSLTNEESETLGRVIGQAMSEVATPTHRYTMHDVMKNVAPEFVERRPLTAGALSFAASIALDPLTYLTFGASGAKVGGKLGQVAINVKRGKATGRYFERVAQEIGEDVVTARAEKTALEGLHSLLKPVEFDEKVVALGKSKVASKEKRNFTLDKKSQHAYDTYKAKLFNDEAVATAKKVLDDLGYEATSLIDRGGMKFAGKTLVTADQVRQVADKVGLTDVMGKLARLPAPKAVRETLASARDVGAAAGKATKHALLSRFSQDYNIKRAIGEGAEDGFVDEYMQLRAMAEARVISGEDEARQMAVRLTRGLNDKERDEVAEVLFEAQTESAKIFMRTRNEYANAQNNALVNMAPDGTKGMRTAAEVGALRAQETEHEVLQRVLNRSSLTDRQREVAEQWSYQAQQMARLEKDVELLDNYVSNYVGVFHKNFRSSPDEYIRDRRAIARGEEPPAFTPGKQRVFRTVEQARNAGYEPITDIAQIATLRFSLHKAAMEQHHLTKSLETLFGGKSKIPAAIQDDFKRVMRVHVDSNDFFSEMEPVFKIFDRMQGWFKTGATVLNPAFAAKQVVGSEAQRIAGGSSLAQMALRISRNHKHPAAGVHALWAMMRGKMPEGIVTDLGRVYTGDELNELLGQYPVLKNLSTEGITSGAGKAHKRVSEHLDRELAKSRIAEGRIPEWKGAKALALRSTRYVEWPQHVEDVNRLATFTDNLMRGFSADEAYRRMEKVHFNYSTGVTEFEDKVMKRLLPFYQFTKFASVLTANMVTKTPGTAAALTKIQREAMRAYGKLDPLYDGDAEGFESLTPSERHALPGFLFEQPAAFAGFDPELREAVFRIFGGVQFLDVLNIVNFDDNGEFNVEAAKRTLVQGSMAQMTPFIKAPLEAIFETEFFTGFKRGEDGSGRRDIDADRFFTALSGALAARFTGGTAVGLGAGAGAGAGIARMVNALGVHETTKSLLGWETAVDPRDGEEKTYINPTLALVTANFFPEFRSALSIAREDLSPTEHTMKHLFGVSTVKLDLQERQQRKMNDATREMRDAAARYKRLLAAGRQGRAEKAYSQLQEAISLMQEEHQKLGGLVRGPQGGV